MIPTLSPIRPDGQREPIPFLFGGSGRYLYRLNCRDQTVSVVDCSSDTVITTITLTASKDFSSIHYRAINQTVCCAGSSWADIIDANPESGTFNTVVTSKSVNYSSAAYYILSYLPYPLDYFTTGGMNVPGHLNGYSTSPKFKSVDGRYDDDVAVPRLGHSNTANIIYHHHLGAIQLARVFYKLVESDLENGVTFVPHIPYHFERLEKIGNHFDLYAGASYTLVFGNFTIAITSRDAYIMHNDILDSNIIIFKTNLFPNFNGNSRVIMEYCPNTKNRVFFTQAYNTYTRIAVANINFSGRDFTLEGEIDRAAYKGTNELCANNMIYNPYNGKLYVESYNSIQNIAGVNKIHVYDPTQALLANMYQSSIDVGEVASATRSSGTAAHNTMCINRTRIYDHPNVFI